MGTQTRATARAEDASDRRAERAVAMRRFYELHSQPLAAVERANERERARERERERERGKGRGRERERERGRERKRETLILNATIRFRS